MRKRILLGVCLLMLLEGCSSSQQNKPYTSIPATPGMTGNSPPVGPGHPIAGVPAALAPQGASVQRMPSSYAMAPNQGPMATIMPPNSPGQAVVTNKPGGMMGRSPQFGSSGMPSAFGTPPSTIDAKLVNATWAETGPSNGKGAILPTAATVNQESAHSDLMYAHTTATATTTTKAALVPPPPGVKEPAPMKDLAFSRDLPMATEAFGPVNRDPLPGAFSPVPGTVPTAGPAPLDQKPAHSLALRTVGTRKFNLAFEVKDAASGSVVEVWATQDQKSWVKIPSSHLPPSSLTVEAPGEGTYGLMLQVRTGPTSRTPRTGDTPHIWVAVDTTKPTVDLLSLDLSLTSKTPGLVVRWKASDRNFGPRPITISYAEASEGPWIPLCTSVNNSGRHEIPVPAHMPRKMLVKIDATDVAGNVGSVQTPQPIRVELPWPPPANEVVAKPAPPPVVQPEPIRPTISVVDLVPSN